MDILVVNWQDRENPNAGGAEVHLHELFGRLAERGHRVTLLASGWRGAAGRARLDGIDVHRVGSRHTFAALARRYFRRHLAGERYDVVVEDLNKIPLFVPRWTGAPTVLLVHHLFGMTAFRSASPPVAGVTWGLERLIPHFYRGVPIVAVSPSTAADLAARRVAPRAEITVIPNGLDVAALLEGAGGSLPERSATPSLVYLGRLQPYKGVDVAIRAVERVRRGGTPVTLWVAGTGPAERSLRKLVVARGLEDAVIFFGRVDETTKKRLLGSAWVHLLPSRKEGWGLTVLEAGAFGTPTVGSSVPGLRDSIEHERTGLLVASGDVTAWAAAIQRLIDDRETAARMGAAARELAGRFDWESISMTWETHLSRMAMAGRKGDG